MNQNLIKSSSGRRKYLWLLLLPALAIGWLKFYEPWSESRKLFKKIERITRVELPKKYSELEIDYPTEFSCIVKMRVKGAEMEPYLREMKFAEQSEFHDLSTWGKDKKMFEEKDKLRGYLGASGVLKGEHWWQIAYDPATEQMWIFIGYFLAPPKILDPKYRL